MQLFNGKDKTGWKTHAKQPGNWRVEKGVLIGSGPSLTSHLYTERANYKDFHLRLEARINDSGNSGVYFRTPFGPAYPVNNPRWLLGYNAKIDDKRLGGFILDDPAMRVPLVRTREPSVPANQWLTLEVIAEGNHFTVKTNGETTAEYTDEKRRFTSGHIALQQHTPQTVCEFRKIEIKELNAPRTELRGSDRDLPAIRVLRGHEATVKHLLFTPDGARLVSASNSNHYGPGGVNAPGDDNTVRVWNIESGQQIRKFLVNEGFGFGPWGIALSRDGRSVAVCTSWEWGRSFTQPQIFVWDIASAKRLHHFLLPGDRAMRAVGFSPDGKMLYAVRSGKGLHSWSMPDGKESGTIDLENQNPGETPFATTFTSGCRYVLGGGWQGLVRLWDQKTGKEVKSFEGHTKVPNGVAMSPDGTRILSCAGDFSVRMWDTESERQVFVLDNLDCNVTCVAFAPHGKSFVMGGEDGMVRVLEVSTRKELARFTGHTAKVTCIACSPDGRLAASGSDDMTIRLWRLP